MYRQPIGDAFLLTFFTTSEPRHILIDCGVLAGVPNAQKWGRDIVRDVARTTGNHLDAIVATCMRRDHVSAFSDARDAFMQFAVDDVWLPWPEDPTDALATRHQRLRRRQLEAVRQARALLDTSRDSGSPPREPADTTLERILAFYEPDGVGIEPGRSALFDFGRAPRFLEEGMPIALPQLPDVRVHVLGPSRDEGLLGFADYGRDRGLYAALLSHADATGDDGGEIEMTQPFDVRQRWTAQWSRENPLVRNAIESYDDPDANWRRIDHDWLFHGAEIAQRLHEDMNRLSLALAFELSSGEVLLFPGDARVSDQDLLARTVFFKVPNHGSDSSLDRGLLEGMKRPDLVAAITADREFAHSRGLEMPAASVETRLLEKTEGRLLRPEGAMFTGAATSALPSNRSFAERTSVTALYVDVHIP